MPKAAPKLKMTRSKLLWLLLSLSFSLFLIVMFVRASLPRHETFVDPMTGLPVFERLLPAGAVFAEESASLLPDTERPAFVVGYSFGSQSGLALVLWDSVHRQYSTISNRLFADSVSGSAAKPPRVTVEPMGKDQPWIIIVRAAVGERTEGVFFALRKGYDLDFVSMKNSQDRVVATGVDPSSGARTLELHDIDRDGVLEALLTTRSFKADGPGAGWGTSVDVYLWQDDMFVYDIELSRILTRTSSMFPEPSRR